MSEEAHLEKLTRLYAERFKMLTYKFVSPAHRGVPDRMFIAPGGRILFIEFKAPGREPTPLQAWEMRRMEAQGASVVWVNSYCQAVDALERVLAQ